MANEQSDEPLADESVARLTIYSTSRSAEELARALGTDPDEAWNEGDPRPRGRVYGTTAISLRSHAPKSASPSAHLDDLLTRIEPLHASIRGQTERGDVARLKLAFFSDSDNPTFDLAATVLERLGSLGIDLELDIYAV